MAPARAPRLHLFVCTNVREGSPLGPGCGAHGDAVYAALKDQVAARRLTQDVWVTRTHCLGICPTRGATVATYSAAGAPSAELFGARPGSPILTEVEPSDAAALMDRWLASDARASRGAEPAGSGATPSPPAGSGVLSALEQEIVKLEELQARKVLDLARRLKPGLTLEDIQNPHDFPELHDPDWHYADGILTGIQSVASALRALRASEATTESGGSETSGSVGSVGVEATSPGAKARSTGGE